MDILNWPTIFKGAGILLVAVYLKPLVMVSRDWIVWRGIKRWMINDQLSKDIHRYAVFQLLQYYKSSLAGHVKKTEDSHVVSYKTSNADYAITSEDVTRINNSILSEWQWYSKQTAKFAEKSSLYDSLVKHFNQDKPNPIDESIKTAQERFAINPDNLQQRDHAILTVLSAVIELHPVDAMLCAYLDYRQRRW